MGFIYCIGSTMLKDDHYKISMTLYQDEGKMQVYLRSRYGTAYGCSVNIAAFKRVGNPKLAEKLVHTALAEYHKGGKMYNCDLAIVQQALDNIPDTEEVAPRAARPTIPEAIKMFTNVQHEFIDDFFSVYDAEPSSDFVISLDVVTKWLNADKRPWSRR